MMAGRCTYGFYQIMGVSDCIATSIEHYIDLAVKLGESTGWRVVRYTDTGQGRIEGTGRRSLSGLAQERICFGSEKE